MTRYRINYYGSGNLATPSIMNTANTCMDQIISPGQLGYERKGTKRKRRKSYEPLAVVKPEIPCGEGSPKA